MGLKALCFALILSATSVLFGSISSPPAYAVGNCPGEERQGTGTAPLTDKNKCYLNNQPTSNAPAGTTNGGDDTDSSSGEDSTSDEGTTCAVEKIGWIVCPIIEVSASMADKLFQFLASAFLEIEPELLTAEPEGGKGTITAWEQARNIANIMFVIAFIAIIYSQVTGAGLNNYGIKRMLPRLVIAAIAVNVSYYLCQAMVDISNLLGFAIMQALQDVSSDIGPQVLGGTDQYINTETSSMLGAIALGVLGVAGLVLIILPLLGSIVLLVLVTCIVISIILLLRKAFIVLLVVISPIAFVAYLLPNTEKLFDRWLKMFWQLLMVFPVVALLLGGGQLASTIILVAGATEVTECKDINDTSDDTAQDQDANAGQPSAEDSKRVKDREYGVEGECGIPITIGGTLKEDGTTEGGEKKQANWTLGLVAAGVAVAPMLAVWSVLQGAISAAGALGTKISGAVQKGTQRGVSGTGKYAKGRFDKSAFGMGREIRKNGKEAYKRRRVLQSLGKSGEDASLTDRYRRAAAGGLAGGLKGTPLNVGTIKAQNQAIERAASARDQIETEDVKNEMSAIDYHRDGRLQGAQAAMDAATANPNNPDATKAKAAISTYATMGERGVGEIQNAITQAEATGNKDLVKTLREYIMANHGDMKGKNASIHAWATAKPEDTRTIEQHATSASTYAGLAPSQMASQTEGSLKNMGTALNNAAAYGAANSGTEEGQKSIAAANAIMASAAASRSSKEYEGSNYNKRQTIDQISSNRYGS